MKRAECGGFRLTSIRYPPNYTMGMHQDKSSHISVVVAGEVREWSSRSDVIGITTDVVVKPSDAPHANLFGPRGACLVSVEWPEAFDEHAKALHTGLTWFDRGSLTKAALNLIVPSSWKTPESVQNAFFEFVGSIDDAPPSGQPPSWMVRVRERLDDTFRRPYSVAEIAREAGVHPVHLARTFRRYEGCTVQEYVRRRRVGWMADHLVRTGRTSWRLALEAGFADGSHATRSFQKELGINPTRYRQIFPADV